MNWNLFELVGSTFFIFIFFFMHCTISHSFLMKVFCMVNFRKVLRQKSLAFKVPVSPLLLLLPRPSDTPVNVNLVSAASFATKGRRGKFCPLTTVLMTSLSLLLLHLLMTSPLDLNRLVVIILVHFSKVFLAKIKTLLNWSCYLLYLSPRIVPRTLVTPECSASPWAPPTGSAGPVPQEWPAMEPPATPYSMW